MIKFISDVLRAFDNLVYKRSSQKAWRRVNHLYDRINDLLDTDKNLIRCQDLEDILTSVRDQLVQWKLRAQIAEAKLEKAGLR
jgi:hypothetical protein